MLLCSWTRRARCLTLAGVLLGAITQKPAQAQAPAAPPAVAVAAAPAAPAEPPRFPDFASVTKDMLVTPGLITLYRYRADDPSRDQTRLLAQIPRGLLRQDLLLATSISKGKLAGNMVDDYLVRLELVGRHVMISTPDPRYVQTPGQPISEVVSRTHNDGFIAALPIITMAPTGDPVVELGSTLMDSGIFIPASGIGVEGQGVSGRARRELSQYSKVKAFPDNIMIEVDLAISAANGPGQRVGLCFSLRRLPELSSFRPRLADERVGYFTAVRQDWTAKYTDRENLIRYIERWDLKKRDASLEMSPPDKPIVFIIEKTVPLQWRKYVADGILEWNKAFEKLGIVDAIVVHQQTDDNEFAQIDPEDSRYNFFRWIVTGTAFAMGPRRADPRTGQILDADIIFDDSFVRFEANKVNTFSPANIAANLGPELTQFLSDNPSFLPAGQMPEPKSAFATGGKELLRDIGNPAASTETYWQATQRLRQCTSCNYAAGMRQQMAMAQAAAAAAPGRKLPEKIVGELIRHTVTHEVGHELGLRHNFKASSWLSGQEIKRRRDTSDEPTSASVMDYNAFLLFPGDNPAKLRHCTSPAIGPYDYWAVEYGYRTPTGADGDEKTMLAKIAGQGSQRELAYLTDEDTMGLSSPDPLSNRFDMSDDPIAWAKSRITLTDGLLKDIKTWAVQKDEPTYYLRSIFETLMNEKMRNLLFASRLVGGQYFSRNRAGDPQAQPALVLLDPQKQRQTITLLTETVFRDDFFAINPELLNDMIASRWYDWASSPNARVDYPVHQVIGNMQAYILLNLTSPQVLQRIYDAELKSKAADRFTAAELLISVRKSVWGNLSLTDDARFTDANPMLTSVRRNLQRQHLQYMLALADLESYTGISPDLQNMVRFTLREQGEQIGVVLTKAKGQAGASRLDFATRAHLTECKSQIDRVLDAPFVKVPQMRYIQMMQPEAQRQ